MTLQRRPPRVTRSVGADALVRDDDLDAPRRVGSSQPGDGLEPRRAHGDVEAAGRVVESPSGHPVFDGDAPALRQQLARVVDELDVDVFAFGITADFKTQLFPGSRRLFELADRTQLLQVEALCWCGKRATHNARVVDGTMVVEGEQVVVGDTGDQGETPLVEYEVLCRRHFMRRMTSHAARTIGAQQMPFDLDVCPVPASTFVASEPAGESSTAHEGP